MYNSGNSSKNVTGASVVDGTLENADYADNGLSGDKIDGGIISNFQSTGIDDRLPTGKVLTLDDNGANVTGDINATDSASIGATSGSHYLTIKSGAGGYGGLLFNDGSDSAYVKYNHNQNNLEFATNGTEKVRILSSGGITFNGDTAAANALDDYEEGTATLSIASAVGTLGLASSRDMVQYTKIGRTVHFSGYVWNLTFSGASGEVTFSGLPFAAISVGEFSGRSAFIVSITSSAATATDIVVGGQIAEGTTSFSIPTTHIDASDLDGTTNFFISGTYIAT